MLARYSFLSKKEIGIITVTLVIFSLFNANFLDMVTESDFFIFSLFGYEKGDFSLKSLFMVLAFNGIPLYLISLSILKYDFEKTREGFKQLQKENFEFIIIYVMLQMLIIWTIGQLFFTDSAVYLYIEDMVPNLEKVNGNKDLNFMQLNPIIVWLDVWLVRVFELMGLQMVLVILSTLFKKKMIAFLMCMALHSFLIVDVYNYYPIGISSIQRLILLDSNFIFAIYKALLSLFAFYMLGYLYMFFEGYKSRRL